MEQDMMHLITNDSPPKNGINFYRASDKHSAGFKFRLGLHLLIVRWSKTAKKFNFQYVKATPEHLVTELMK